MTIVPRQNSSFRGDWHAGSAAFEEKKNLTSLDIERDFVAYERALREAADQMVRAHVAMARAAAEGGDVLTEEQRQQLQGSIKMMRGVMGQGQSGMMGPRMMR